MGSSRRREYVGESGVVLKGMYGAAAANGAPTALRTVLNAGFPSY
jgi:hypothetical protein